MKKSIFAGLFFAAIVCMLGVSSPAEARSCFSFSFGSFFVAPQPVYYYSEPVIVAHPCVYPQAVVYPACQPVVVYPQRRVVRCCRPAPHAVVGCHYYR